MESRKYNLIEDPGHAWLEVPLDEVFDLKIKEQITPYSFLSNGMVYLEEDYDMFLFLKAKLDILYEDEMKPEDSRRISEFLQERVTHEVCNTSSPIRNYKRYPYSKQ